ncbi:alpha/beta hydrolase [Paenibacillus selenitireducens]|uniref:Alpha/beta hydrolase n=1 Tax=Paenibacillus selenitireducens TaxID=1324314 RepID=A0A1T2X857_9BACL|nr:alpha/beta hydrolase [Paenibacillus selenitireducens]OPA75773.1 alpha/beta hydrolase [Paenibacillus selenitireducens]
MTGIWIVVAAAIAAALLFIGAGVYFYNFAIRRTPKEFLNENVDVNALPGKPWQDRSAWLEEQTYETLEMTSKDGIALKGYFIPAPNPTSNLAILVHGYTGRGKDMAMFAHLYRETFGFHVLMPDLRGHGESAGEYIGFGWHDRDDLINWIHEMIERMGQGVHILLHGVSMGGGTVLMTSGEALPDQVKGIISDCAYTSVKGILSYQLKQMFKLPAFPLLHITSLICKLRANYFFGEASALNQVRKNKKPILFIHGGKDTFVPTEMVYPLFEASGGEKKMFLVPDAGHGNAFSTDVEGYTEQVGQFVHHYVMEQERVM